MTSFLLALRFLTIIPVGRTTVVPSPDQITASGKYYPLIGLLIGGMLWGFHYLAGLAFPVSISVGLLLAFWVLLTGALHLDGLADALDGFYAGANAEERLRIMKDIQIGTMGIVGLVLLLGMKYLLLKEILSITGKAYWLIILPLASRWAAILLSCFFPYARSGGGLGQALVSGTGMKEFLMASIFAWGAALVIGGVEGIGLLAVLMTWGLLGGWYSLKRLQGITGDVIGGVIESGEVWGMLYIVRVLTKNF
jgi:adenosylcobinamide-GDP ribazoletransferase